MGLDRLRAHVGIFGETVGDHRAADARKHLAHGRIVDAEHGHAVERQALKELDEGVAQALEVAAVGLHVICVDVGDDGNHGLEVQEGRIGLVGLRHEMSARAEARIRPALLSRPPITKVGSSPAASSTEVTSEVVVVLPCVPATAMPWR